MTYYDRQRAIFAGICLTVGALGLFGFVALAMAV